MNKRYVLLGFNLLGWIVVGIVSTNIWVTLVGITIADNTARALGHLDVK